jgi:5-methylcytosine-specific restriction endonuclease McrA
MTSRHIPVSLVRAVRERARHACEYCQLPQEFQEATFHVDHVKPRAEGGQTVLSNLALACVSCSLHKADRLAADDPATRKRLILFNPRADDWKRHFAWDSDCRLVGRTPRGRATIFALRMNRAGILAVRRLLAKVGHIPRKS